MPGAVVGVDVAATALQLAGHLDLAQFAANSDRSSAASTRTTTSTIDPVKGGDGAVGWDVPIVVVVSSRRQRVQVTASS